MSRCLECFKEFSDEFEVCPYCGNVNSLIPNEPIHLHPGTVLADRYLLGKSIGEGGFGIVYKAWDLKLETIIAIKEFYVGRLTSRAAGTKNVIVTSKKDGQAEFKYRKARFLAEARNMAKLGSHKSFVNVFEFFEENNTAYIVMELLDGIQLGKYLKECGGKLDTDSAVTVAVEVGKALSSLHEKGIIHCDVAPDNIFICPNNVIKLLDLGAAKLADAEEKVVDIVLKPGYSPPEQYDNSKNIGPWSDIYALGATLYVMLTGEKPDESTNRKIKDELLPPNEVDSNISEDLSDIIMRCMAIEKHLRYKNIAEFLKELNGEKKAVSITKVKKRRKRMRFSGIVAALLTVIIASSVVIQTYNEKKAVQILKPASISLWFSVKENSNEEVAINNIVADFTSKFTDVEIEVKAIPEAEYNDTLLNAAKEGNLPNIFESSGVPEEVINQACDLDNVLTSEQAASCLFLDQYNDCYSDKKQLPLAIEVPMVAVITRGPVNVDYQEAFYSDFSDFNTKKYSIDEERFAIVSENFDNSILEKAVSEKKFFNNKKNSSAVLLSSTMSIREINEELTSYTKNFVFSDAEEVYCDFIYEWSMGSGNENQIAASERLLEWMLGNVYQTSLMISNCNDGQIPINKTSFETKCNSKYLKSLIEISDNLTFEDK